MLGECSNDVPLCDQDHTPRYIGAIYIGLVELSPTAKVILGTLRMRPRSGYEIKGFIDKSTRFFYSAGFGSIYPELKRRRLVR